MGIGSQVDGRFGNVFGNNGAAEASFSFQVLENFR
jgi:hypothetical protein